MHVVRFHGPIHVRSALTRRHALCTLAASRAQSRLHPFLSTPTRPFGLNRCRRWRPYRCERCELARSLRGAKTSRRREERARWRREAGRLPLRHRNQMCRRRHRPHSARRRHTVGESHDSVARLRWARSRVALNHLICPHQLATHGRARSEPMRSFEVIRAIGR